MENKITECIHCRLREVLGHWGDDLFKNHIRSLRKAKYEHRNCQHRWEYNHDQTYKFCRLKCGMEVSLM